MGVNEAFFAYELFGISRRDLLQLSLIAAAAGFCGVIYTSPADSKGSRLYAEIGKLKRLLFRHLDFEKYHRDNFVFFGLLIFSSYIYAYYYFQFPDQVFVAPDSWTYLAMSNIRPLMYPIFIRLFAILSDHQTIIIEAQLLIGLLSTAFLAEAIQRVTKNYILSLGVGILTISNWELFRLGVNVLSDYPFFITFNFALGMCFLAMEKTTKIRLSLLALIVVISVGIRPTGMLFVGALPALLILSVSHWRRILGYFAVPMFSGILLLATVNHSVLGYFGLSQYSGYPMMANTLFILEEDTPFEEPGYVKRLYQMMAPYREGLAKQETLSEIRLYQLANTNIVLGEAWRVLNEYRKGRPDLGERSDTTTHRNFATWFTELSPLNARLGKMGVSNYDQNNWADDFFARLGKSAHMHNPEKALELFWAKLYSAWIEPYQLVGYPTTSLSELFKGTWLLDFEQENFGFWVEPPPEIKFTEIPYLSTSVFSLASRTIGYKIWYPAIALVVVLALCSFCLYQVIRRRSIPADIGALTLAGLLIIAYHAGVSLAHVPIARYSVVVFPAALLLLFAPIHFAQKVILSIEKREQNGNG